MKTIWQLMFAAVALAVTVGVVTACSDDSDTADQASSTTATSDATTSTVAAPNASEPLTVSEQEESSAEAEDEFIELAYFEILDLGGLSITRDEECDQSDPEIVVCAFGWTTTMRATIIGEIDEVASGTNTTYPSESCTNPSGETVTRTVTELDGTMTAGWGDELYFSIYKDNCTSPGPGFFEFTGGTGRFLDAHGLISQMTYGELIDGAQVSAGTLNVRADLWEPILAPSTE
jgi:hypothetical protein